MQHYEIAKHQRDHNLEKKNKMLQLIEEEKLKDNMITDRQQSLAAEIASVKEVVAEVSASLKQVEQLLLSSVDYEEERNKVVEDFKVSL